MLALDQPVAPGQGHVPHRRAAPAAHRQFRRSRSARALEPGVSVEIVQPGTPLPATPISSSSPAPRPRAPISPRCAARAGTSISSPTTAPAAASSASAAATRCSAAPSPIPHGIEGAPGTSPASASSTSTPCWQPNKQLRVEHAALRPDRRSVDRLPHAHGRHLRPRYASGPSPASAISQKAPSAPIAASWAPISTASSPPMPSAAPFCGPAASAASAAAYEAGIERTLDALAAHLETPSRSRRASRLGAPAGASVMHAFIAPLALAHRALHRLPQRPRSGHRPPRHLDRRADHAARYSPQHRRQAASATASLAARPAPRSPPPLATVPPSCWSAAPSPSAG